MLLKLWDDFGKFLGVYLMTHISLIILRHIIIHVKKTANLVKKPVGQIMAERNKIEFKGPIPTTVNGPAATATSIINFAFFKLALPTVKAAILADAPWLKLPVINQVFNFLLNRFATYFYDASADYTTLKIIQVQTDAEKSAYAAAEGQLHAAMLSKNPALIASASANFDKTLGSLVHWNGS